VPLVWLRPKGRARDTENSVRIENEGFSSVREIIIVSTMSPFVIVLLALVASVSDLWMPGTRSGLKSRYLLRSINPVSKFSRV
jgi:hypothetical protein